MVSYHVNISLFHLLLTLFITDIGIDNNTGNAIRPNEFQYYWHVIGKSCQYY
ncbi:hypothetical protein XBFM1_2050084 [Xenorhabdus bovienii str. feltiae Moldova]|uniref:Uncharacterized protein n=2 Tax=Xenorhabdus bovienii TaxID=40576 RepID=A0A0B6X2X4_XENBV|nr:hypothetical protein XBFM1_2050084 [Xenorhabdus bovienii str. feltiae Moldova]CDM87491.1 protein of unknown function [Xenorhabdus bovienii]